MNIVAIEEGTSRLTIKIFYSPRQTAAANRSYSPSAQKPALVVDAWRRLGLPLEFVEPVPASVTDFCRAHDQAYVLGVLAGRVANGFGNTLDEIRGTLPWTSGSMISAAEHAVRHRECTFSPTSGFHHAGWQQGNAFCTFNGLLVAALALHARGLARRVAILDCDQHFGDGTRDIIRRLGLGWIAHYTYGASPVKAEASAAWLAKLPELVSETLRDCELVLYQAGADPHREDPLGGAFTTDQLAERDRIVYETCRELGVPVVTTLAGGYQKPVEKVVQLHVNTLLRYAAVHGIGSTVVAG
ncbi:MAG: histone deacetylase [Gemmatimonadota bacterium]|nr:histone deacetylase [Gemmatimonadota bacterium]